MWGTLISALPAGIIVQKIKCKTLLSIIVMISSIFTLLLPVTTKYNWQYVCALRFVVGMTLGFWQPCMNTLLSAWLHQNERTFLSTLVSSGAQIGIISMLAASGEIAVSSIGWPGIFYLSGSGGLLWTIAWHYFGCDSPKHSFEEKTFLLSKPFGNKSNFNETKQIPFGKMMKSSSFWALIVGNCGGVLAYSFFLTEIPSYINYVLNFNIQSVRNYIT